MKQYLLDNEYRIETDNDEHISIKQIKDSIKALETLGRTIKEILTKISLDEDGNKHLTDDDWKYISNPYSYEGHQTEIINDKYIIYGNKYKIRVNKDDSFTDLDGEYVQYIKTPIKRLTIKFK